MTQWRILLARTRFTQPVDDSVAIGLWVERDSVRYQYFTVGVSDTQLHEERVPEDSHFWDAAAMVATIQIRELLPTFTPIVDEPTFPFKVELDLGMVDEVTKSETIPKIAEGTTLDEWTT